MYDYVLNNKQLCEIKRIQIQVNPPILASNLNDALLLGAEELLEIDDEEEEKRLEELRREEELAEQLRVEEEERAREELERLKGEETDEDLKEVEEKLKRSNLDKESKLIIHNKMANHDSMINKTIEEK